MKQPICIKSPSYRRWQVIKREQRLEMVIGLALVGIMWAVLTVAVGVVL